MRDYCPVGLGQETEKVRAIGAELEGLPAAEAKVAGRGALLLTKGQREGNEVENPSFCFGRDAGALIIYFLLTLWNLVSLSKLSPGANAGEIESKVQKHIQAVTITRTALLQDSVALGKSPGWEKRRYRPE